LLVGGLVSVLAIMAAASTGWYFAVNRQSQEVRNTAVSAPPSPPQALPKIGGEAAPPAQPSQSDRASAEAAEKARRQAELAQQEERTYNSARGNIAALRAYTDTCKLCAFDTAVRAEIGRLEAAAQEEQSYSASRGNLASLRGYVSTCKLCAYEGAARAEIGRLETAEQEERTYSSAPGQPRLAPRLCEYL